MMDHSSGIGMEEWTAELERLVTAVQGPGDQGFTSSEIAKRAGMARRTVTRRLRDLIENDQCKKGRGRRKDAIGKMQSVPVYRLRSNVEV